jgi:hypothetical protein
MITGSPRDMGDELFANELQQGGGWSWRYERRGRTLQHALVASVRGDQSH